MAQPCEQEQSGKPAALFEDGDEPHSGRAPRSRRRVLVVVVSSVAVVVVGVVVLVGLRLSTSRGDTEDRDGRAGLEVIQDKAPATHQFVVPAGTAARLQQGLHVDVVPDRISVHVGDTIRIRNDDEVAAQVGVFNVAPGVTVTMRFTEVGRLEGYCSVDPDGRFVIDVRA